MAFGMIVGEKSPACASPAAMILSMVGLVT
jgi:hypothetical protein